MSRTDAIRGTYDTCAREDDDNGRDDDRGKENDMRREEDRRGGEDDIGGEADCMRGRAVDTGGVEHSDASLISVGEQMREEFAWPLPEERVKEMMEELRETQVGRGGRRWRECGKCWGRCGRRRWGGMMKMIGGSGEGEI